MPRSDPAPADAEAVPPAFSAFRLAGRVVLVALVIAGMVFVWLNRATLDAASIAANIARLPAAPLVFLVAHVVASIIFFPRTILAAAAGAVFGVWWGTLWAALGSVIGAAAGFLLARYVNAGWIDLENLRRFGPALRRAEKGGWRAVAMLRLVPIIPHTLTNYALGLTRLSLGSYAAGSLVGQLPMTIACADFGAAGQQLAAGKAGWIEPTIIGLGALAVTIVVPRLVARRG
ncbi:MAG TPA: VTT domain-containing protein [Stellaceae bacterium]|nr:VTT domain-containing protein [Stellaceae bacterium]